LSKPSHNISILTEDKDQIFNECAYVEF